MLGAGAIGCTLGGLLQLRGAAEVAFVARGAQLDALRRRGLRLELPAGPQHLAVRAAERLEGGADVVLAATKTQDLAAALRANAAAIGGATVVTAQNGLAAEALAAGHVPAAQVVGCICLLDACFLEPGVITVGALGGLVLGRAEGPVDARVRVAATLFQAAGVAATSTDRFRGARWTKLLVNLNNALPAATGRTVQDLYADPRGPLLAARSLHEGLAVARAEGVRLEPLPWASPALLHALGVLPPRLAGAVMARRVRQLFARAPLYGSTLQSLKRGKPTEIDHLNGEVVARGLAHGVPTPVNAALLAAVKAVEAGGPFADLEELAGA